LRAKVVHGDKQDIQLSLASRLILSHGNHGTQNGKCGSPGHHRQKIALARQACIVGVGIAGLIHGIAHKKISLVFFTKTSFLT